MKYKKGRKAPTNITKFSLPQSFTPYDRRTKQICKDLSRWPETLDGVASASCPI